MKILKELKGKTFNEGIKVLGVKASEFDFVNDNCIDFNIEYTTADNIKYLVTYTLTEDVTCEDEEVWYPDYENFNHVGYWHYFEIK